MHTIDWIIMLAPVLVCAGFALYTRRYVRSVADFMAGGRNAGRYLICAARSEQGSGAVVYVAILQSFLVAGFTINWWAQLAVPLALLVSVTGFITYRYRETRALTLGQFFEMRYSRSFRLAAGGLGFFAGLVNFGIIPVIGAQFMVYFLRLPIHLDLAGVAIPTHLVLMAVFLTLCVAMTVSGGQVSVLVTDCAAGMISQVLFTLIAIIVLVSAFDWNATRHVLLDTEPGKSYVNPFDSLSIKDFNIWFILMGMFLNTYRILAWQNSHAFNSSAASAHESRMGAILGNWRTFASWVMVILLSVSALTFLRQPAGAAAVDAAMSGVQDPATRDQMRSAVALTQVLPTGAKGALLCICLMGILAGDGMHLHSWGSIFIQDVIMPLRRRPLTPTQHIRLLRLSIIGVALWAFLFGALFPQTKYISLWFVSTEAIFVSGAGIAIIGGLYWSRGTTAGAWSALLSGAILTVLGICAQIFTERVLHQDFPMNGQQIAFVSSILALLIYLVVSYVTCSAPANMKALLHRDEYADPGKPDFTVTLDGRKLSLLTRVLGFGIDEQFSQSDRWVTMGITAWSIFWFAVFLVGSLAYKFYPWSNDVWAEYWLWSAIYLPLLLGVATTIWFTIGCSHDMIDFLRKLKSEPVDLADDGTVQSSRFLVSIPSAQSHTDDSAPASSSPSSSGHGTDTVPENSLR